MPPSARCTLAFDTSQAQCAVALIRGDALLSHRAETMARGQAERLMPLIQDVLDEAGMTAEAIDVIGVGVGPGNFTGIRIGVAAARGLSLSLGVPAVGVSNFEAMAHGQDPEPWCAVPAPRDTVYVAHLSKNPTPRQVPRSALETLDGPVILLDSMDAATIVTRMAFIAAQRAGVADLPRPAPVYVRPADAAPPRDTPPTILDAAPLP